jgi:hypothetical protein
MKIKNSIIALILLAAVTMSGQVILSVESNGTTDLGNEVSAIGSFEFDNGQLSGWIQNTTAGASLTGFWLLGSEVSFQSDLVVSHPWDYVDATPNYLSNYVSLEDSDLYFGFDLDVSQYGFAPALENLEIFTFSFMVDGDFFDTDTELPDALFRWQQVGFDNEDSGKSFATYTAGSINPVPEPAAVGLIAGLSIFLVFGIQQLKRFRK